ncbi:uncharacterized protein LOC134202318 [Armigeres subalbatus]|uniref:uncharacterized protein LOC134202318 n=1 Tax=Armigeres subalbatus TaxID=124917 RepID=UPI002ED442C3
MHYEREEFCVVKTCMKKNCQLFPVPHKGSSVFKHWSRFVHLSGYPGHRICDAHFTPSDFLSVKQIKLKITSVPSILPKREEKVSAKTGCCVVGCRTRKTAKLLKFPAALCARRKRWNSVLGLPIDDTTRLKICRQHFTSSDFIQTTRRYLKPSAVPTRGVTLLAKRKLIVYLKDSTDSDVDDQPVPEHGYCVPYNLPRSRAICFVPRCTARAGNGIKLHKFPLRNREALNKWIGAIKSKKRPTKYSAVCSRHFKAHDYLAGMYDTFTLEDLNLHSGKGLL